MDCYALFKTFLSTGRASSARAWEVAPHICRSGDPAMEQSKATEKLDRLADYQFRSCSMGVAKLIRSTVNVPAECDAGCQTNLP